MRNNFIEKIISGGQSGVDRAALDIAIELNIPHGGWCPWGRKAEDGVISNKYNLQETLAPSIEESKNPDFLYKKRTELNVIDSDGTLIITPCTPTGGTQYTVEVAQKHKKPHIICKSSDDFEIENIINWLLEHTIHQLNVAGPRASQYADIYSYAYKVLAKILNHPMLKC